MSHDGENVEIAMDGKISTNDESWINKIMRDATSRNAWYLMTTLMFNLQLLEEGDDRTEDK